MNKYSPDNWVIVKLNSKEYGVIYKILCSWGGSYQWGASWKLSSGIETFIDDDLDWISRQDSGSVYKLRKSGERMSSTIASIYNQYHEQSRLADNFTIEIISSDEYLKEIK